MVRRGLRHRSLLKLLNPPVLRAHLHPTLRILTMQAQWLTTREAFHRQATHDTL
jgi:hypothetical protein